MPTSRVRRSLTELQAAYDNGDKAPLEALMRAWKGIKELPAGDPRSFFVLGGYHGEPFRGGGWGSSAYWGGYCHHGNILFPLWHRFYLLALEDALRSIPGCGDVTLPFWDECSPDSVANGIPHALTDATFMLDGAEIANPLKSFKLPLNIIDNIGSDQNLYTKWKDYETVRYPFSGLVGTKSDQTATSKHNGQWTYEQAVPLLDANIVAWLDQPELHIGKHVIRTGVHDAFLACLDAPNYTVFSNTTSAAEWNANQTPSVVPIESPHNKIHLAVGGFDVPKQGDFDVISGANGDMGENDTAGLDPIFYFHHCFIDRVFWLWQQRHSATHAIEVIDGYPGTNSADNQGPTPGIAPNAWLSLDTPLEPFKRPTGDGFYTGREGVNIDDLGYAYGPGSLEDAVAAAPHALAAPAASGRHVHVSGVNRGHIRGSFLIAAYAQVDGKRTPIGTEAVLSRWHVEGCMNCQTHLGASAAFPFPEELDEAGLEVEVRTRDGLLGDRAHAAHAVAGGQPPPFRIEVR
jgi:tyrosinase